jgi:uncharacterized protein (TIGR03435 family)
MAVSAILTIGGSLVFSIVAKASLVLVAGLSGVRIVRRSSAAINHAVLASTFAVLLLLPIVAVFAPPVTVRMAVPDMVNRASRVPVDSSDADGGGAAQAAGLVTPIVDTVTPRRTNASAMAKPVSAVGAAWALGVILCLIPIPRGLWWLRHIRRSGVPWAEGQSRVDDLRDQCGIRRRVAVLIHHQARVPMTGGALGPVVVLPADVHSWSPAEVDRAIVHEMEHVRRCDWCVSLMARTICALYWFHPLVWAAWRQIGLAAERACDDAVLDGGEGIAYAEQLVALASRLSVERPRPVLGMTNRTDLSVRVHAVLDVGQRRGRAALSSTIALAMLAAVVLAAVSPLRAVAAPADQTRATGTPPKPGDRVAAAPKPGEGGASFDRISIQRHASSDARVPPNPHFGTQNGGLCAPWGSIPVAETCFRATGVTVRELLRQAFAAPGLGLAVRQQVVGGPGWIDADRFDVVALAKGDLGYNSERLAGLLRTLVRDRFHVAQHQENQSQPIYELVAEPGKGTTNAGLHQASTRCIDMVEALRSGRRDRQVSPSDPCIGGIAPGFIRGGAIDMQQLAVVLSNFSGRMVLDRTGLTGFFAMDVTWPASGSPAGDARAISDALRAQLGLVLKATTGSVAVQVIDSASPPAVD